MEDTPIFNALWEKYNATPIFDQVLREHEHKKYLELVEPYKYPLNDQRVFSLEEFHKFLKSIAVPMYYEKNPKKEKLMNNWQRLVNEFREAFDLPIAETPRTLSPEEANLHIKMIRDEFEKEFVPAFLDQDLTEMYDSGIDILVYVIGALSNAGFDIDPGFKEVMKNNMSKINPVTGKPDRAGPNDPSGEPEGKILKPAGFVPVNLHPIINAQFNFGPEDTTVYRTKNLPLTFGEGGPVVGKADVVMDHNGVMTIDATVEDVDFLPKLEAVSLLDVYIPENPTPEAFEDGDHASYKGEPMLAEPQDQSDWRGMVEPPTVMLGISEDVEIDFNDVAYLDANGKERSTKQDREERNGANGL